MKQKDKGFTLIEILVVISIIGFLASVILVGLNNARIKARDAKRIGDMSQMQKGLEIYYNTYRGYPAMTGVGLPLMTTGEVSATPVAPLPADGSCGSLTNPFSQSANSYYYSPSGSSSVVDGLTVYPDYGYYFCLGRDTGNYTSGRKYLSPKGVFPY
jgi:general secretion pathway protein G